MISVFAAMPPQMRRSLTWDQGKEMACHLDLTRAVSMPISFCQRSSPWQRGSNKNRNGLLRDDFPKATDLWVHTADRLAAVANEHNDRPRKNLAWTTPRPSSRNTSLNCPRDRPVRKSTGHADERVSISRIPRRPATAAETRCGNSLYGWSPRPT
jgi:IS30 family transposase